MTFQVPIGNDFKVGGKLMKKQGNQYFVKFYNVFSKWILLGGEYRYTPYSFPPTAYCDAIISDKYVYPDVLKQSDFPQDVAANCPVPPVSFFICI